MTRGKRPSPTNQIQRFWRRRRFVICILGLVVAITALMFGPKALAVLARHMASREMAAWAIGSAQQWLTRAASLNPSDGTTDLMRAVCFRRLDQMDDWSAALQAAKRKGAPATQTQLETEIGFIQSGRFGENEELRLGALIEEGGSTHDVAAAFVHGFLVRGEYGKANMLLQDWGENYPNEAHVAYMRGVYGNQLDEPSQAIEAFEDALTKQPHHEPARRAIAELCETGDLLGKSFGHFAEFSARSPANAVAKVGLARVLRKRGNTEHARDALEPLASLQEPPENVAIEMGQIEFETGNYEEAERWYARVNLEELDDAEALSAAATVFAFCGNVTRAERLFARNANVMSASTRMYDLEVSLTIDPNDRLAVDELQRLAGRSNSPMEVEGNVAERPPRDLPESSTATALDLYTLHCAACHGIDGAGDGRAAWHLFPVPRDFRSERFRLVSTLNGVPSLDDLMAVTKKGMPGTSMPAFEDLSEQQHRLLAQEVLRLHREGMRTRFIEMLASEGEEIDEGEVSQVVEAGTIAGEALSIPQIGPLDPQSVTRGKGIYYELGCNKCHGEDGIGDGETPSFDENGCPIRPRDLAHEPFKGGQESESIYLRIALGMPGSPHPASPTLAEAKLIDLVQFCRSLSKEPKRSLTNHQRAVLASGRAYRSAFADSQDPVHDN